MNGLQTLPEMQNFEIVVVKEHWIANVSQSIKKMKHYIEWKLWQVYEIKVVHNINILRSEGCDLWIIIINKKIWSIPSIRNIELYSGCAKGKYNRWVWNLHITSSLQKICARNQQWVWNGTGALVYLVCLTWLRWFRHEEIASTGCHRF